MDCVLVLEGHQAAEHTGNVLLDLLFGAEITWAQDQDLKEALQETFDSVAQSSHSPYLVPIGGSNPIGSPGCVEAMGEFLDQGIEIDRTECASALLAHRGSAGAVCLWG